MSEKGWTPPLPADLPTIDPLKYLRDLQVVSFPTAPPLPRPGEPIRAPRPAPTPVSSVAAPLDPCDLPALALAMLAEGQASHSSASPPSARRPLQRRALPGGGEVSLPIRYFDARCWIAAFSTPRARAAEALAPLGLQPVCMGDAAMALFGCFEYRDTDLGPYSEVGLTIPALAASDPRPALAVLHLPVNTAETDRVGRALWGYPKFVADIDIRGDARAFATTLRDSSGAAIASLEGALGPLRPSAPADLSTYTRLDGRLLRTRIDALTAFSEDDGAGFRLQLGSSVHPMTQTLRALGLDNARPSCVRYADPFQAMLFPGFPA